MAALSSNNPKTPLSARNENGEYTGFFHMLYLFVFFFAIKKNNVIFTLVCYPSFRVNSFHLVHLVLT